MVINLNKLIDDALFEKGYETFTHDVKAQETAVVALAARKKSYRG